MSTMLETDRSVTDATAIAADFWAIVGALVVSLIMSMAFAGVLMQRLVKRHAPPAEES